MTYCDLKQHGKRLVCPNCDQPKLPASLVQPVYRECTSAPAVDLTWNDLETLGPCPHLGPILRTAGCELCGKKDKQVQVHACRHPEKQGHEVSQDRYSARQFRTDVCRTCKLYPTAAGTSADPPARDASGAE